MNWKVIYFGAAYALIFSGYYLITSFLNVVYQKDAFISFAIFYGIYAVCSLIAPFILSKLNYKLGLFLSALSFLVFVGMASSTVTVLMLIGSGISGAGNSLIWLIQGVWISNFSESQGNLMGIFYAVFCTDLIISNLLGLIVLLSGVSVTIMMWLMMIPTGIGTLMTLFVQFEKKQHDQINFFLMLKGVFTIAFNEKKGFLIIAMMMAQAIGLNVTYQILPKLIIANAGPNNTSGPIYNTATFLAYGVSSIIFSYIWGKLYDKFSWKSVIFPYLILEISCQVGILLLAKFSSTGPLGYWIIIGFVRGIIDYAINNALNIIISTKYPQDCSLMFGFFRFIYAVSYVVFSVCVGYLQYEWVLLICGIFSLVSVIFIALFFKFNPISQLEKEFELSAVQIN